MSQYVPESGVSPAIERREQLIDYFAASAKPRAEWRIGTEYEKVAVRREDGRAVPYSGPRGIEALLRRLAGATSGSRSRRTGGWSRLSGRKAAITLEPGGQGRAQRRDLRQLHCAAAGVCRAHRPDRHRRRSARHRLPRPRHAAGDAAARVRAGAEEALPHHVAAHGASARSVSA
ncbi:MAG: hypothetical protein U0802_04280 [Candidatus Binatia bacterium]